MKEVLDDIERWQAAGHRVAIARVVGTEGSSPRDPGATMAVSDAGEVAGSVSGGCVEGAVVGAALEILAGERERGRRSRSATPTTTRSRSASRAAARSTCSWSPSSTGERLLRTTSARRAARRHEPVALVTVVDGADIGAKLLVRPGRRADRHARRRRPRSRRRPRRARRARGRPHLDAALRRARRGA